MKWLNKLENLIDMEHVGRTSELQRRAFAFEPINHIPTAINYPLSHEDWPQYGYEEIWDDPAQMLLQELCAVYASALIKDDRLYGIRANYGTGIIASMFDCQTRTFDDSLPIALHLSAQELDRALDAGVPDIRAGIVGKALDTVAFYHETLKDYPKLSKAIGSSLLDIQGPFDNASIIWGSEIFLALYDEPEKVKLLLELVTESIMAVVREHRRIDGQSVFDDDGAWQHLGGVCVRNDSSINLSLSQYEEFAKPYDSMIIGDFGGWIHFCGQAHQWWESLLNIPGLKGINPYQGEFYDLMGMYNKCEEAVVSIVQWTVPLDEACRKRIRTGLSRMSWQPTLKDARSALERLHKTGHADE